MESVVYLTDKVVYKHGFGLASREKVQHRLVTVLKRFLYKARLADTPAARQNRHTRVLRKRQAAYTLQLGNLVFSVIESHVIPKLFATAVNSTTVAKVVIFLRIHKKSARF